MSVFTTAMGLRASAQMAAWNQEQLRAFQQPHATLVAHLVPQCSQQVDLSRSRQRQERELVNFEKTDGLDPTQHGTSIGNNDTD
ncbi:MAG: hypothetical protein R3C17_07570 [Planctomycetaceae bacterium]